MHNSPVNMSSQEPRGAPQVAMPAQDGAVPAGAVWQLTGHFADGEPARQFRVERSPYLVGRRTDAALCIPSPTVSNNHAELLIRDSSLIVRDLGSTNGTFVNGVRVQGESPVRHGDLLQFAHVVFRTSLEVEQRVSKTIEHDSGDRALALIQFDKLMTERAVAPHYQPIVSLEDGRRLGFEILARSRLFGLTDPHSMFSAAALLNMESELSRIFRLEGVRNAEPFPKEISLFANTHPAEMEDLQLLIFSLRELRELEPQRPLVLEIHESAVTERDPMLELRSALFDMNIQLAYDDFGAGQARLVELVEVPPDFLKFDMKLIQGIGTASRERQNMLGRLVEMVVDLGITPLAEGVEQEIDSEVCKQIGFVCGQGYLYGRPALPKQAMARVES